MSWARDEVEQGQVGPGAAFVADAQTGGRGRHGRSWFSIPGKGLYLTVVIPPALAAPALTLAAAVAVAQAAEETCGVTARIKWPNDLLAGGRKWGGVLAESTTGPGERPFVLLGVGVNVNHAERDFPDGLATVATSLAIAGGGAVDREALLEAILHRLQQRLDSFGRAGFGAVADAYRSRAVFASGDLVEIAEPGLPGRIATFKGLDSEGRLLLEEDARPLASGDVMSLRRSVPGPAEPA